MHRPALPDERLRAANGDRPPPPRRVLLVVNPAARRAASVRAATERAFAEAGVRCDVLLTTAPGEGARAAIERHTAYDAVFTLGGDGTAMEIVGALAGTGRPVGVLPGGTGNLIARTLHVPLTPARAVATLLDGDQALVDLGALRATVPDGQPGAGALARVPYHFAFTAGVGVDAAMIEGTTALLKRRLGVLAYSWSAARAVLRRETFTVRAEVDGVVHERADASAVMIANFGAVLDELFVLGPGIAHDDGLLDLCIFTPGGLRDAVRVMGRLLRKDFRPSPHLLYVRGARFRVETSPVRTVQADGELVGCTPLEVRVEPHAARLLVPRRR